MKLKRLRAVARATILLAAISMSGARAADLGYSKSGATYLEMAPNAQALAMGQAQAAVVSDASALWSNPAALPRLRNVSVSMTSALLGQDRSLYFAGVTVPFHMRFHGFWDAMEEKSDKPASILHMAVSGGVTTFGIGSIDGRDDFGAQQAAFKDTERSYYASFGIQPIEAFSLGFTYKKLTQTLGTDTADASTMDLGAMYTTKKRSWGRLAFAVVDKDMAAKLKWKVADNALAQNYSYDERIADKFVVGSMYERGNWQVALDAKKSSFQDYQFQGGVQWAMYPFFQLRAGLNVYDPTFGFGLILHQPWVDLEFHYAFQYATTAISSPHLLTVGARFGRTAQQR